VDYSQRRRHGKIFLLIQAVAEKEVARLDFI